MSKAADYLLYHFIAFGGVFGLIALVLLLFACYLGCRRRDYQTAIEMTCIAWFISICAIALAIVRSFRTMGGTPKWWEIQLNQIQPFASILVIPVLLTIPVVWFCLEPVAVRSIAKSRLLILAVFVALLDLLIYVTLFVPVWGY